MYTYIITPCTRLWANFETALMRIGIYNIIYTYEYSIILYCIYIARSRDKIAGVYCCPRFGMYNNNILIKYII